MFATTAHLAERGKSAILLINSKYCYTVVPAV
jgi:hypothetical protein